MREMREMRETRRGSREQGAGGIQEELGKIFLPCSLPLTPLLLPNPLCPMPHAQ
jgi:hypothetical protein